MATLLPILMYHQVVPEAEMPFDRHLYVTPETLTGQILELKRAGFQFVTLREAWTRIRDGRGGKAVALTFDDLYDNVVRHAIPVLQEHGVRATVFAITQTVGRGEDRRLVVPGLFGVNESSLRDLVDAGLEVGSHTVSHRELTSLDDRALRAELSDSRHCLEDMLGVEVTSLCYPRGRFSPRVVRFVEAAGYDCACTTLRGTLHTEADRWALRRVRAGEERIGLKLTYALTRWYHWLNLRRARREEALCYASDTGQEADD